MELLMMGLGRANTMSTALEVLGISLPYSASIPAEFPGSFGLLFHIHHVLYLPWS